MFRGQYIDYPTGDIDKADIKDREWTNNPLNYDNVPEAMLTLFTVSTFEGWPGYVIQGPPRANTRANERY